MIVVYAEITLSTLGVLMVYSGGRKAIRRRAFQEALEAYKPVASPKLLAPAWAAIEMAAGAACLVPFPGRALGLTWVVAGATGAVARRVAQGETHDCGCHAGAREVSPRALVGNVLVIGLLCALSFVFAGREGVLVALGGIPIAAGTAFILVGSNSDASDAEASGKEAPAPA